MGVSDSDSFIITFYKNGLIRPDFSKFFSDFNGDLDVYKVLFLHDIKLAYKFF